MDKLINSKKLTADLRELQETLVASGHPFLAGSLNSAIECVGKQPAVEVKRCGDCEFWKAAKKARRTCDTCEHKEKQAWEVPCARCFVRYDEPPSKWEPVISLEV